MTVGRCIACADCGTSGGKQFRYEYVESGNEYSLLVESAGDCSGKPRIRRKGEKPKEATEKPKEVTVQELADIDRVIDGLRRKEEKILPSTVAKELASTSGGKPFGMDAKKFRQACWRRKVKIFGKSRSKKHTPLTWSHDWKRYVESRQERVGVVWMEEIDCRLSALSANNLQKFCWWIGSSGSITTSANMLPHYFLLRTSSLGSLLLLVVALTLANIINLDLAFWECSKVYRWFCQLQPVYGFAYYPSKDCTLFPCVSESFRPGSRWVSNLLCSPSSAWLVFGLVRGFASSHLGSRCLSARVQTEVLFPLIHFLSKKAK